MSDYISREAALEVFCRWCGICPKEKQKPLECDDILGNVLHSLPAADVRENVKARWIDMGDHLLCSGCGATHYGADKNFCPNCGADMRVSPKLLIYDDTNINIGKKNFTESGKLHTIDKECARRYLEGKIFFGFIIDAFNRIINRINEIEDVINQK